MKKLLLVLVAVMASYAMCQATTESDCNKFKSLISTYLQGEGYLPKIDSDGDVQFKHDGDNYWVQVSPYDDGYYVTVMTATDVDGFDRLTVLEAMDDTMSSYKYVRQYTANGGRVVYTQVNWFCSSISDFKTMFSNALSVVETGDSNMISELLK